MYKLSEFGLNANVKESLAAQEQKENVKNIGAEMEVGESSPVGKNQGVHNEYFAPEILEGYDGGIDYYSADVYALGNSSTGDARRKSSRLACFESIEPSVQRAHQLWYCDDCSEAWTERRRVPR